MTVLRVIANEPRLFRPFVLYSSALVYSDFLPAAVREVVVLWIARHVRSSYEWHEHLPIARRVGVTDLQIQLIGEGALDASAFSEQQLLALRVASSLLDDRQVPTDLWEQCLQEWNAEGTIDLIASIAWWAGSTRILLDALGLRTPDQTDVDPAPWETAAK